MTDSHYDNPPGSPLDWLRQWITEGRESGLREPTAMSLATVDNAGRPSNRIVLFKGMHDEDICFYTNYQSRKATQLAENDHAALCFWWDAPMRQIRVEGRCEKLPQADSDAYFASRARGSQLGAWASQQSQPTDDREALERAYSEQEQRFAEQPVERPPHWGGYCLHIDRIEFWQGRDNRFHDRVLYQRQADSSWDTTRLQP